MIEKTFPSFLLVVFFFPTWVHAEGPTGKAPIDGLVYETKVGEKLSPTRWQIGPSDPKELNRLISHPCFEYSPDTPYCMPQKDGDKGFVCSGQSAAMVAHLRSLGLKAMPFYLEWKDAAKKTEAHAMVVVPFQNAEKQSCHHVLEVARSWPRQPVVEFSCCQTNPRVSESDSLRQCTLNHFLNPPDSKTAAKNGVPARTPLGKEENEKAFKAFTVDTAYDLSDPFNPGTPIWTLEKNRWACPNGLCTRHPIASHITIDQSKVSPGDRTTYGDTKIVVDYRKAQEFECTVTCPAKSCLLRQTGEPAPAPLPVTWPPTRATCGPAAILRAHLLNPRFTCKSLCETPRPAPAGDGYLGGRYIGEEPQMACQPTGVITHTVRSPRDLLGPIPKETAPPRHDGANTTVR